MGKISQQLWSITKMYAEQVVVRQKIRYYFEQAIKADRVLVLSLFHNL